MYVLLYAVNPSTHIPLQHKDAWLSIKARANSNHLKQKYLSFEIEDTLIEPLKHNAIYIQNEICCALWFTVNNCRHI